MRLSDNTKQLITEAEIRAQDAKFRILNSTATTNGAVVIDGGVGIAKSVFIGGDLVGSNTGFLGSILWVWFCDSIISLGWFGLTNTGATLSACRYKWR